MLYCKQDRSADMSDAMRADEGTETDLANIL
jgi:hypothetical protein